MTSMPQTSNGSVDEVVDAPTDDWWKTGVVYQVYPRSFQDFSGDGIGDLRGITERLGYLLWLGIDVVWLSPFYPSPMKDFGYDVTDYCEVDPMFGTLDEFDRLITEAHRLGLKVMVDFVPNHTSDLHPWFAESRADRTNDKRDWYIWSDAKPDGAPPNNWLSVFGGPAWTLDDITGQYYLHSFLPEQPDTNWFAPNLRKQMFGALGFWLERGVDGFRVDAAPFMGKDPELRDNPLNPDHTQVFQKVMADFDQFRHVYDIQHPVIHEYNREMRALLDSYSVTQPRAMIAEVTLNDRVAWASYYGINHDGYHMPLNFNLVSVQWKPESVRAKVEEMEACLTATHWPNYLMSSHDELRIASRFGVAQARASMLLLLTLRGTPTLYYGDEIGMLNATIAPDQVRDPWGIRMPGYGRDPGRTPMQWDASAGAGFTRAEVTPWLPLHADHTVHNVEMQSDDECSMLSLTRRLLAVRRSTEALVRGAITFLDDVPHGCLVYVRHTDESRCVVVINFTADCPEVMLPGGAVVSSTGETRLTVAGSFSMRAYEALVVLEADAGTDPS